MIRPEERSFAVTLGADGQQQAVGVGHDHADDVIVADERDAFDAAGVSAQPAGVGLLETDRHAGGGRKHHFVAGAGHNDVDHFVALAEFDGDDAAGSRAAVRFQAALFYQSVASGHHQEVARLVEISNGSTVGDFFALAQFEQIHHGPAAARSAQLRQIVNLQPVNPAEIGEEHQIGVGAGHEQMFDRIFFFGAGALEPLAAAPLRPIDAGGGAFDVTVVADGDDHGFFGDQVSDVDLADFFAGDFGAPLVAVLALQLLHVIAHHRQDVFLVGENAFVFVDVVEQLLEFAGECFLFQVDQRTERHPQNGVGLHRSERVVFAHAAIRLKRCEALLAQRPFQQRRGRFDLHQPVFCFGLCFRRADHSDHFVDIGVGQQQALDRVLALPRPGQQKLRAAAEHGHAMPEEFLQHGFESQYPRLAVDQGQQDDREGVLQRRELEKLGEHDLRIDVSAQLDHQTDRIFQIALVADAGDAVDPLIGGHGADALFDAVAGLLIGDFRNDDTAAALGVLFNFGLGSQDDRAAASVIALANSRATTDHAAGGKVGTGDDLHQFVDRDLRFVDDLDDRLANFAHVVWRNRRGHADRDSVGAVDQQIRISRGQHSRFGAALVVGRNEIDRIEIDVVEQQRREGRHAGFGVSHGRRRQPGDRAEIALLVDQHVPHVPFLGHAHQGRIDDAFAVRMIVAAGVAGDLGAFDAAGARREIQIVHRHENSPLRRLQPVAHVGQRAADDDAHGVGQVTLLQLLFDRHLDDTAFHGGLAVGGLVRIGRLAGIGRQRESFRR